MAKNKIKKSIGTIYEVISILLFLAVCFHAYKANQDHTIIYKWCVVPLIPFLISLFYRSDEIGNNIKKAGVAIASMFTYLDSIGFNGLPALAILVLISLFLANLFSTEKVWSEMMKIVGGIASGSLAQAKISKHQSKIPRK